MSRALHGHGVDSQVHTSAPNGLPRLLGGVTEATSQIWLPDHLARYGPTPQIDDHRAGRRELLDRVQRSGLRGRGGAAFPTAVKLQAAAASRRGSVVVANGAESEPASAKDRTLLTRTPHLVLDGAAIAATLVGATEVVIAVDRAAQNSVSIVDRALRERRSAGLEQTPFRIVETPSHYVAGEETALVHWLNGGPAKPTFTPPRPFEKGVDGRPTVVQNVETLAHLALITRFGSSWFRKLGTPTAPGSALMTVSGAVARPGVLEIAYGTSIRSVLHAACGTTEPISALLVGGYFGAWLPAERAMDVALDQDTLAGLGAGFGCGVLVALPVSSCGLTETARVMSYLAAESAEQCGPCVHGLASLADGLGELAHGPSSANAVAWLQRWADQISGRGACHHPDGAIRLLTSALHTFASDVDVHRHRGSCPGSAAVPILPVPDHTGEGWR